MNRKKISSLLDLYSECSFNNTDRDPNWYDEVNDNSFKNKFIPEMRGNGDGDDWNNNFDNG